MDRAGEVAPRARGAFTQKPLVLAELAPLPYPGKAGVSAAIIL